MKNKITKILGLALAVVTVASLFIGAVPAAAATHAWSTVSTPSAAGFVVSDWTSTTGITINSVGQMVYNSDKSVIYAVANIDDGNPATYVGPAIFKSTNSGRTWTRLTLTAYASELAGGKIYDIVTSPVNVNELYFTNGTFIYTSKDAGVTWTKLSSVYQWAIDNAWTLRPDLGANLIVTLDVAQYGAVKLVFAGTSSTALEDDNGVYVCTESDFGMPWNDLGIRTQRTTPITTVNVMDVKVDPTDFAVKQGVFAVITAWTDADTDTVVDAGEVTTLVTAKYMGNQWNQASLCKDAAIQQDNTTPITTATSAEIYLPSDFSSNAAAGKFQAWVGLNGAQGDVYMWIGGVGASAIDLNVSGLLTDTSITDIDGAGTIASPKLIVAGFRDTAVTVPVVFYSANGYSFVANIKGCTGNNTGLATVNVLALSDFATSGKALAATSGYGAAVSYTADFCATFNQISLMATNIATLDDLGGSMFIVTTSSAGIQSVWRQVVIGDVVYWERVYSEMPAHANIALSGQWDIEAASDGTLFLADVGGVASTGIWRSTDNGQTWAVQFNTIVSAGGTTITAWMPVSASSVLVGGVNKVYVTTTNGIVWFGYDCLIGTITDFDASGSTWLAAGVATNVVKVAQSTNSGITWTTLKQPGSTTVDAAETVAAAIKAYVSAAYDFATTGNVFISTNAAGVFRYVTSATLATDGWLQVDNAVYDTNGGVTLGAGMVAAQGGPGSSAEGSGMVYVTDNSAATAGGVSRIKGLSVQAENLANIAATFKGLWLTASGTDNVLWTLGSDNKIYTYTDTTNKAGSGVAVVTSNYSSLVIYGVDLQLFGGVGGWMTTVKWNAMANVTEYLVYVTAVANDPASLNMYTANTSGTVGINRFYTANTTATVGMSPNTTYYVSVWATEVLTPGANCSSFLFDKAPASVTTAPGVANWTPNLFPNDGASNVPVNSNFAWDDVVGATGYEFQIAEGTSIPAGTATIALTVSAYAPAEDLAYDTTYTWQVRAVSGSVKGAWVTSVLTTEKEPLPVVTVEPAPTPTIIVTAAPQITVTQQQPAPIPTITIGDIIVTQAPLEPTPTPAYIWLIVGVGALLTIAVVVLIIRTRRVV